MSAPVPCIATVREHRVHRIIALPGRDLVMPPPRHVADQIIDARADLVAELAAELSWSLADVEYAVEYRTTMHGQRRTFFRRRLPVPQRYRWLYGEIVVSAAVYAYQRPPRNTWYPASSEVTTVEYEEQP